MRHLSEGMGKVPQEFLENVVFRNLGARSSQVILGPGQGRDNAVLEVGKNKVMIATSDPLSIIPSLGMKDSAWLSAHLLASDLSASGVRPQFGIMDLNLPPKMELDSLAAYLENLGAEFERLGVSIIGGHTGRYPGCDYSIVGGGVLFSFSAKDEYVAPSMARAGDKVLLTKGAAIATTAVLARAFPDTVRDRAGKAVLRKAQTRLRDCSTVKEALALSALGLRKGVSAMHDATEGGVLGGLHELSIACGRQIVVEKDMIRIPTETQSICSIFGLDPLASLSEGSLLVTVDSGTVDKAAAILQGEGIECCEIGDVRASGKGVLISERRGTKQEMFVPPKSDPYWSAYAKALRRGWT